jgi:hypothetical protein
MHAHAHKHSGRSKAGLRDCAAVGKKMPDGKGRTVSPLPRRKYARMEMRSLTAYLCIYTSTQACTHVLFLVSIEVYRSSG